MNDDFWVFKELFHKTDTVVIKTTNTTMGRINSFFEDINDIPILKIEINYSSAIHSKRITVGKNNNVAKT